MTSKKVHLSFIDKRFRHFMQTRYKNEQNWSLNLKMQYNKQKRSQMGSTGQDNDVQLPRAVGPVDQRGLDMIHYGPGILRRLQHDLVCQAPHLLGQQQAILLVVPADVRPETVGGAFGLELADDCPAGRHRLEAGNGSAHTPYYHILGRPDSQSSSGTPFPVRAKCLSFD